MNVRSSGVRRMTPLLSALLMAGCSGLPASIGADSGSAPRAGTIIVADGHGWTSSGLDGTIPAPGSCHIRTAADGEPLPDPTCTPGAIDTAVTDTDIATTICRK